jgi:hypothetical protein
MSDQPSLFDQLTKRPVPETEMDLEFQADEVQPSRPY